jgi:hypothetical protein
MTRARVLLALALASVLGVHPVIGQELSRYRAYALGSSVATVVAVGGIREADIKTLHTRPAKIQQVEWRAPYSWSGSVGADPVQDVVFSFHDDRLYQVVVTYDRDRMAGLTNADVIEVISATYGPPVPAAVTARAARGAAFAAPSSAVPVARWENDAAVVTLTRFTDVSRFQLVVVSKALSPQAEAAAKESVRLDAVEAPKREMAARQQEAAAALVKSDASRTANKAAFRP